MRVIAGTAKGHPLVAPTGRGTRPTADRVREAVFSSLQPVIAGTDVLDLYAGSGAMGIEALSRGAASATLVERHGRACATIRDNLVTTKVEDRATVVTADVRSALRTLAADARRFDVVFCDPPYRVDVDELDEVLGLLAPVLVDDGLVRLEQAATAPDVAWPAPLLGGRVRRYGDTRIVDATRRPA